MTDRPLNLVVWRVRVAPDYWLILTKFPSSTLYVAQNYGYPLMTKARPNAGLSVRDCRYEFIRDL
jgi:hypothetical protein